MRIELESDRTCCCCRTPGRDYHIHHLDGDRSNDVESNLVLLCLLCHSEAERTGGLGRNLTPDYIRRMKAAWIIHVAQLHEALPSPKEILIEEPSFEPIYLGINDNLKFEALNLRYFISEWKAAVEASKVFLELPAVLNPSRAISVLSQSLRNIFSRVAESYPRFQFGRENGTQKFDKLFETLLDFELSAAFHMRGMQGQYSYVSCGLRVVNTIEKMIIDTIRLLDTHCNGRDDEPTQEFKMFESEWLVLSQSIYKNDKNWSS